MSAGCSRCGEAFLGPTIAEAQTGICERCRGKEKKPSAQHRSTRPTVRPCERCGHEVLVRCNVQDNTLSPNGAASSTVPLAITYERTTVFPIFGSPVKTNTPDTSAPLGVLEPYFCRACGYVLWFVRDPEKVPIGPEYGTELIDLRAASKPYR